ncbi:MAG: acyltransferase family protein [Polyangia bacterium]
MATSSSDRVVGAAPRPAAASDALTGALERTVRGHMPVLDALRGLAILLVIAHRAFVSPHPRALVARVVSAAMDAGWVGVQLFFVLSGSLITGILLDSRDSPGYYRSFFARRVLRIFPLYYAVLVVAFVVVPLATGQTLTGSEHQLWLWVYLSNWMEPFGFGVAAFPHFWSLAVEEQFYALWPLVVRATSRRALGVACVVLVVVAIASRVTIRLLELPTEMAYSFTICRVDALAMGAGAALVLRTPSQAAWLLARQRALVALSAALFLVGAVATSGYPRLGWVNQAIGYSLLAWLATVGLVVAVLAQARGTAVAPAPLRSIGKYSYAMYVLHVPIHHQLGVPLLRRFAGADPSTPVSVVYFVALTAASYLGALLSYHLYERHFLALKRFFPVARPGTA